ncbi:hypothetical protein LPTSP4_19380 [Leptospira ryugenii]|uniref:PF04286 domain protein n=1 Tax=Leptospira ryugenii TaxID=1917863 RepID=A0A2P2E0L5_9LEPT|nr:DUF445 family protein [Leptospira ryugenii]GBF50413.1 hypothetical protein LPTSP4_19380 [Leptospira ryugenii]
MEDTSKLILFSMPFTYALIGYITNWLAIKMTFYPIRFYGYPPFFGWQGIIPRKANKIGSKFVEVITEKLLDVQQVTKRIDETIIETNLLASLEPVLQSTAKEIANGIEPQLWEKIPESFRKEIILKIKTESGNIIKKIIREIQTDLHSKLDIKKLVYDKMTGENTNLIVEMFQTVGGPEFKFIERSGLYFGFLIGLFQLFFWFQYPLPWSLPLQGVLVGYITNFLAIQMIFRPLEPRTYFGVVHYHGLFLKRKVEVSRSFAKIVSEEILSAKNILDELLFGKAADILIHDIQTEILIQIDKITTFTRPLLKTQTKWSKYEETKLAISKQISEATVLQARDLDRYVHRSLELEKEMSEKMIQLSSKDFESILRSAFQEDELLLILVGAFLGGCIGFLQMILV